MFNKRLIPLIKRANFLGVNAKDTAVNFADGEWHEDSINIISSPKGALGSRAGFSALTVASIGSDVAWCGFFEYQKHVLGVSTKYYVGGDDKGWAYNYSTGKYTVIGKGFNAASDDDKRYSFFTLNNILTIVGGGGNWPCLWTGSGSILSHTTAVTADWGMEWQRYGWLHSTDDPRLLYYCDSVGNPNDAYTSFLNFDEDAAPLTGSGKQGDDLIAGKEHALYRVQYRGTAPLFKKYRIPSNIGPVNFETIKTLPDGSLMFLASNCNFYMLMGDTPIAVGDNIQPYVKGGVLSRLKYAVSGLNYRNNQYWCSLTITSGATQNDRTIVMDYSRPYTDVWGKTQYPWFIFDIPANCFAEVTISGTTKLYYGSYGGKIQINDSGTSDDGTAIRTYFRSGLEYAGDISIEKKWPFIEFSFQDKGDYDLDISFVADENPATQKIITQSMLGGVGDTPLWDSITWNNFSWASEVDSNTTRHISLQGKTLYVTLGTDGLDEAWNLYWYALHARGMSRTSRHRER